MRKLQEIIRDSRKEVQVWSDPVVEPFGDGWPDDPDEIAFLLSLREAWMSNNPRVPAEFHKSDIKWALKLSRRFGWPESWDWGRAYLCFKASRVFADREINARSFGREPYFSDLSDWLTLRPWESDDRQKLYEMMEKKGVVTKFELYPEGLEEPEVVSRERLLDITNLTMGP